MKPWKLFNERDEFFWVGTYSLAMRPPPSATQPPHATYSYDRLLQTLTVTVHLAHPFPEGEPPVVGIILFNDSMPDKLPLMLNYSDRNLTPTYSPDRRSITQTLLLLFDEIQGGEAGAQIRAKVMVNLEQAIPTFVIPAS